MNKKKLLILTLLLLFSYSIILKTKAENPDAEKKFNPKPASASVYNLGLKSYEQGDIQSAISFFKRAIDLDPLFVDAYFNLGAIYKKQKNFYSAIQNFKAAVEINPNDFEVVYELASCYMEGKNYKMAQKYFSFIPSDFPKYSEAKVSLDKATHYLTLEAAQQTGQSEVIKSPEVQGQLLADTLAKDIEKDLGVTEIEQPPSVVQKPPADSNSNVQPSKPAQPTAPTQAELLVNTLTKPNVEAVKETVKTVSSNFDGPAGIAKDSKNNIFIANFTKNNIEKISPNGTREVFAEKLGLSGPVGLAIDSNDNLYVANYNGNSIVRISPDKTVSVIVDNIIKPYYLFFDIHSNKLFATVQGNDSVVEIDTASIAKQPITSR